MHECREEKEVKMGTRADIEIEIPQALGLKGSPTKVLKVFHQRSLVKAR